MAHYALLDETLTVVSVITGVEEGTDGIDWEQHYGEFHGLLCKRTSYNTRGGEHSNGGTPFRKNYAGIGYTYDPVRDAFIPPRPDSLSWVLDEQTCQWAAPVSYPDDGDDYLWDEDTVTWVLVE
jgi:hypothetical protein